MFEKISLALCISCLGAVRSQNFEYTEWSQCTVATSEELNLLTVKNCAENGNNCYGCDTNQNDFANCGLSPQGPSSINDPNCQIFVSNSTCSQVSSLSGTDPCTSALNNQNRTAFCYSDCTSFTNSGSTITNSKIGENTEIKRNSVVNNAIIGRDCIIDQSTLSGTGTVIANFVTLEAATSINGDNNTIGNLIRFYTTSSGQFFTTVSSVNNTLISDSTIGEGNFIGFGSIVRGTVINNEVTIDTSTVDSSILNNQVLVSNSLLNSVEVDSGIILDGVNIDHSVAVSNGEQRLIISKNLNNCEYTENSKTCDLQGTTGSSVGSSSLSAGSIAGIVVGIVALVTVVVAMCIYFFMIKKRKKKDNMDSNMNHILYGQDGPGVTNEYDTNIQDEKNEQALYDQAFDYNIPIISWNIDQVVQFVKNQNTDLIPYAVKFRQNEITGRFLAEMDRTHLDQSLKEIEINNPIHRGVLCEAFITIIERDNKGKITTNNDNDKEQNDTYYLPPGAMSADGLIVVENEAEDVDDNYICQEDVNVATSEDNYISHSEIGMESDAALAEDCYWEGNEVRDQVKAKENVAESTEVDTEDTYWQQ